MRKVVFLAALVTVWLLPVSAYAAKPFQAEGTLYNVTGAGASWSCTAGETNGSATNTTATQQLVKKGKNQGKLYLEVELIGAAASTTYTVLVGQTDGTTCYETDTLGMVTTDGSGNAEFNALYTKNSSASETSVDIEDGLCVTDIFASQLATIS